MIETTTSIEARGSGNQILNQNDEAWRLIEEEKWWNEWWDEKDAAEAEDKEYTTSWKTFKDAKLALKWEEELGGAKKRPCCLCIRRDRPVHISLSPLNVRYKQFGLLNVFERILYYIMRVSFISLIFYYLPLMFTVWANLRPLLSYWETFTRCVSYV